MSIEKGTVHCGSVPLVLQAEFCPGIEKNVEKIEIALDSRKMERCHLVPVEAVDVCTEEEESTHSLK